MSESGAYCACCCSDLQEFETSFQFACPKFLSPVPPNYDVPLSQDYHKVIINLTAFHVKH